MEIPIDVGLMAWTLRLRPVGLTYRFAGPNSTTKPIKSLRNPDSQDNVLQVRSGWAVRNDSGGGSGASGFIVPVVYIVSPFEILGLPYRILHVNMVIPKNRTAMETIGRILQSNSGM